MGPPEKRLVDCGLIAKNLWHTSPGMIVWVRMNSFLMMTVLGADRPGLVRSLADLVAKETGIPLPPLKPLVGGYAYLRHMPGDVLSCIRGGVDQFPSPAACVHPSVIGAKMSWVWDSLSTDANVRALAASLGETLTDDELPVVRAALDGAVAAITTYPRWLTAEQATEICRAAITSVRQPQPV